MTEAPGDRLEVINREIRQVEDMIRQLHERRSILLQQLNDGQASTRVLPPETLSLIFEYARPQDISFCSSDCCRSRKQKGNYSVLTFGHVSSHWRRVAWSTPQLWTDMDTCVRKKNAESIPCILGLHLQNVRGLPFNLKLNIIASGPKRAFRAAIQPIKLLLDNDEYSRKVRTLHFCGAPAEWTSSISSNFSRLENLKIGGPFDSHLALEDIPLLRHLCLQGVCGNISVSGSSITKLDLRSVPINTCASLLTQCPNLIDFCSASPLDETAVFHPPTSTIILRRMKKLSWAYHDSPYCLAAFKAIKLPALRTLTWWDGLSPVQMVEPSIRVLLADRLDTLLTLELSIHDWTPSLTKYVFEQCRRVQSLRVMKCDRQCLSGVLDVLRLGWGSDGMRYLPSLTSLTIDTCFELSPYDATDTANLNCTRQISEFCRARWTGPNPNPKFKLRLNDIEVRWSSEVQKELSELVRNGFQLDIFESGERMWWLPQKSL